jgi:integrase
MGCIEKKSGPRGTTYKATIRTATRRKRSRTFKRKTDADRWITMSEAAVMGGRFVDPRAGRVTIAEAFERWLRGAVHLSDATRAKYASGGRNHVLPALGAVRLSDLHQPTIRDWIADMHRAGLRRPSIENARLVLSLICAQALSDGKIAANSVAGTRLPRNGEAPDADHPKPTDRRLTTDEVWAISDAIQPRYRAMVLVAGFCGLRFSERSRDSDGDVSISFAAGSPFASRRRAAKSASVRP